MFSILFPYSYVAIGLGILMGIGITTAVLGFMSAFLGIFLIYIGIIRITPALDILTKLLNNLLPEQVIQIHNNIKESFKVRFTETIPEGKYIYTWHPHGVYATSHFFHIGTTITNWPNHLRNIKGACSAIFLWLPFGRDLLQYFSAIPCDYHVMKNTLIDGTSISVAAGGMREMLGNDYIVKRRRGIFKMALETGTPIVPIISFGEDKLFSVIDISPSIQKWLEPYDTCICIPTLHSIYKWLGILQNPLKDPITSVVGAPILVSKTEEPTEANIAELREQYIAALKKLFTNNPNKHEVFSVI